MAYLPPEIAENLQRFVDGPSAVHGSMAGLDAGSLSRPGKEGWSIRDVLVHLSDTELVRAVRFRTMLTEDSPQLAGFDQEVWKRKLHYLWRSPEAALSLFQQLRYGSAEMLRQCDLRAWDRIGVHPERGNISVADLVRIGAEHVDEHVAQIAALRGSRA